MHRFSRKGNLLVNPSGDNQGKPAPNTTSPCGQWGHKSCLCSTEWVRKCHFRRVSNWQDSIWIFFFFFLSSFGKGHRSLWFFFPWGEDIKWTLGHRFLPDQSLAFIFFFSSANIDYAPTKCHYNWEKDSSALLLELPVYGWAGGEQRYPSNKYLMS